MAEYVSLSDYRINFKIGQLVTCVEILPMSKTERKVLDNYLGHRKVGFCGLVTETMNGGNWYLVEYRDSDDTKIWSATAAFRHEELVMGFRTLPFNPVQEWLK
jgi:hypothetical protein